MKLLDGVRADATVSDCGTYRYSLTREWDPSTNRVLWVMLNPSVADADVDDQTIRKCISFSQLWGFGSLGVVNLFALRSPDPKVLRKHPDPVGPDNDAAIITAAKSAPVGLVVCAWGVHGWIQNRGLIVERGLLRREGVELHRVGPLTAGGHPGHPLYLKPEVTPCELWEPAP